MNNTDCPSNNVVTLSCAEENKCGIVDNPIVTSYVVGGEKVSEVYFNFQIEL